MSGDPMTDKPDGKRSPSLPFQIIVCAILGGVVTAIVTHTLAPALQEMIPGDLTLLGSEILVVGVAVGASIPILRRCFVK
jgi:hypothetical protein